MYSVKQISPTADIYRYVVMLNGSPHYINGSARLFKTRRAALNFLATIR